MTTRVARVLAAGYVGWIGEDRGRRDGVCGRIWRVHKPWHEQLASLRRLPCIGTLGRLGRLRALDRLRRLDPLDRVRGLHRFGLLGWFGRLGRVATLGRLPRLRAVGRKAPCNPRSTGVEGHDGADRGRARPHGGRARFRARLTLGCLKALGDRNLPVGPSSAERRALAPRSAASSLGRSVALRGALSGWAEPESAAARGRAASECPRDTERWFRRRSLFPAGRTIDKLERVADMAADMAETTPPLSGSAVP